ncbi:MAG: hypothetical protein SFY80_08375 [Verrucomicrobiota bacterium]|nr:hypothetical protein [Verrucomicrobiota bacterium]
MIHSLLSSIHTLLWCAALLASTLLLQAKVEEPVFIFEGTVSAVDKPLTPLTQTGDVISGSITLKPLSPKDALPDDETRGKYEDYILGAELTLDRHYVLRGTFKLDSSRPATAFTALGKTDAGQPQTLAYTVPIDGRITGIGDLQALWLELWLYDTRSRMLLNDALPYKEFPWEAGTFRITFFSPATGGYAYVSGAISRFSDDEPDAKDNAAEVAQLEQMVVELNGVISRQQADITDLNARLTEAKQHSAYLEEQLKTAKAAVEESPYKAEAEKLKSEVAASQAETTEVKNRVMELEVDRAEEVRRNEELRTRNNALQAALVAVQQDTVKIQMQKEQVAYELAMVKQMRAEAERSRTAASGEPSTTTTDGTASGAEPNSSESAPAGSYVPSDPLIPPYNPPTVEEVEERLSKHSARAKRFIRPASSKDFSGGPRKR